MFFLFKDPNEKYLKKVQPIIGQINSLEVEISPLEISEMKERVDGLKNRLQSGETLDDILPMAFALLRESAKRTLKQRHFDSQLIGGIVLHQGKIAEMATGEGKTLTSTLPIFLNGLTGKGVHLVTVNDYLAKRDAVWMGQIYHLLGLSVGCIVHDNSFLYDPQFAFEKFKVEDEKDKRDEKRDQTGSFKVFESYLRPCSRKEAYQADITYGTNNEFGFDYLRDNMVFDAKEKSQRGFHYAIVDEIDSILIDEARTPLIISQPDFESSKLYKEFARFIPQLKKDIDFNVEEKQKSAFLNEQGIEKIEKILRVDNIYEAKGMRYLHYLEQALRAEVFFLKDRDYVVKNNEVIIIDEFTGRLMPGRRYSGGLHQAIEAKERVEVQPESKILAQITFQNYFRFYEKLAGMTGTAITSAEEFDKVYKLETIVVPTNKPCQRKDLSDKIYKNEKAKFSAVVEEIKKRNEKGQPILVGTRSVAKNEYLSKLLDREGVNYEILNAKNHQREGEIIAQAGREGAVTVATNMAGRGVDIMLGGVAPNKFKSQFLNSDFGRQQEMISDEYKEWQTKRDKIISLGGLFVLGTEHHEARRIDDQLRGRSGRQGDPGESQFFVSLEDDLMRIFGGEKLQNFMNFMKIEEDAPIESKMVSNLIEKAQNKVEGIHFDSRKYVLEYDEVLSKQRNKIYQKRDLVLSRGAKELKDYFLQILRQELSDLVSFFYQNQNLTELIEEIRTIFPLPISLEEKIINAKSEEELLSFLVSESERLLEEKEKKEGEKALDKILRFVFLKTIDIFWTEHLVDMNFLQDSSRLKAFGGRDPLVEYKISGSVMFQKMEQMIEKQIVRTVFKLSAN